ncbi:conserved hypothetical protein [Pseudomonas sp. 8AS]|nr:conserved hypothetical protein [Pseudomonas sp. 8AS]
MTPLLHTPPGQQGEARFFPLLHSENLRLKQIVSHGQASPAA